MFTADFLFQQSVESILQLYFEHQTSLFCIAVWKISSGVDFTNRNHNQRQRASFLLVTNFISSLLERDFYFSALILRWCSVCINRTENMV